MLKTLALVTLLLTGCASSMVYEPTFNRAQEVQPVAKYTDWFHEVEECTGKVGGMWRIHWYVMPDTHFSCGPTIWAIGCYIKTRGGDHEIFIASDRLDDSEVIKHELIHFLIQKPGHPEPPFEMCEYGPE